MELVAPGVSCQASASEPCGEKQNKAAGLAQEIPTGSSYSGNWKELPTSPAPEAPG